MMEAMSQLHTDSPLALPKTLSGATGLLRCLGALGQEATEMGLHRTATALYQALGVCLRETLGSVGAELPESHHGD